MTEGLRYGIVALARSDRRLMEATLQSIARLSDNPDAVVLAIPKLRAHLFADAATNPSFPRPLRVVTTENADALPVADGFRALAPKVGIIAFVPEGVVLAPDYLTGLRETAERWQDMVGEIDVIRRVVGDESPARNSSGREERRIRLAPDPLRWFARPRAAGDCAKPKTATAPTGAVCIFSCSPSSAWARRLALKAAPRPRERGQAISREFELPGSSHRAHPAR